MDSPAEDIQQPYDTLIKAFFRNDMGALIPYVLKGATLDGTLEEAEQNVEIDRSMLKADLAYRIKYHLLQAILHIELQSGPDSTMARRMLAYFANLHLKYNVPIFCIVIFLFKCAVERSPYKVSCDDKVMLPEFHYDVIRLWEVEPEPILNEHDVQLYVLLPGMKDPTIDMLRQAIREMYEYYDSERIDEHLAQFHIMLRRTTTVSDDIKDLIGKELYMSNQYAEFLKQHPYIDEEIHRCKDKLLAKGKVEYAQESILKILRVHCPDLFDKIVELPKRLESIQDIEILEKIEDAGLASDGQNAQALIEKNAPLE